MAHLLIAIEGIDGVGKTTTATRLAEKTGARLLRLPPEDMQLQGAELLADLGSIARYAYYVAAALRVSERAKLNDGVVLVDRYIDSAHAMHAPLASELESTFRELPIVEPDLVILLEAREEVRRTRLETRGRPLDSYEEALNDDTFRETVLSRLRSRPGRVVVETSDISKEGTFRACLSIIESLGGSCV